MGNLNITIFLLASFLVLVGAIAGLRLFSTPLFNFLEKLGLLPDNPELETCRTECLQLKNQLQQLVGEKEALRQEGLRLQSELQQQRTELTDEFRCSTFEQLQTLLTNYPSIQRMVSVKPELPAKNLMTMFTYRLNNSG